MSSVRRTLVIDDGRVERQLQLIQTIVVGRDPECDVSEDSDSLLSRRHAEFTVGADGVRVRDLGSRNGTFVNGARVAESRIASGDVVGIGQLRVRYAEEVDGVAVVPSADEPVAAPVPVTQAPEVHDIRATREAMNPRQLARYVLLQLVGLATVVFIAVAAAAAWRTGTAATGDGPSGAGGLGWLMPPALIAIAATYGAWRLIDRRLER